MDEGSGHFGVRGISRDKKTGQIVSEPSAYEHAQLLIDLFEQIRARLKDKAGKKYPSNTVLIINCIPDGALVKAEWNQTVEMVPNTAPAKHCADPYRPLYVYRWD